ncbi:MAG TPA: hypothetical protein VNC79_12285 [Mycobacteriales bacterium]|nr:hypothetical protein [Mycobacteriales bacterium]
MAAAALAVIVGTLVPSAGSTGSPTADAPEAEAAAVAGRDGAAAGAGGTPERTQT